MDRFCSAGRVSAVFSPGRGGMLRPWAPCGQSAASGVSPCFSGLQGKRQDRVIVETVESFFAAGLSGRFLRSGRDLGSDAGSDERTIVRIAGNAAQGRFRNSSKARALRSPSISWIGNGTTSRAVMDADNTVQPDFLRRLNETFETGTRAVQAHRQAKTAIRRRPFSTPSARRSTMRYSGPGISAAGFRRR